MLPPLADQVTAVVGPPCPWICALKAVFSPALRLIEEGVRTIPVTMERTVTEVLELLLGSATDVAVTVKVPAVEAVNTPFEPMLPPPLTDQVTPGVAAPLTVAEKGTVLPASTVGLAGLTAEIEALVTVTLRVEVAVRLVVIQDVQFPA